MFMEQFSLLPQMVEIVTATHKLLISISLFSFQVAALQEFGLSLKVPQKCSGDGGRQHLPHAPEQGVPAFWRGQSLQISPKGAFV